MNKAQVNGNAMLSMIADMSARLLQLSTELRPEQSLARGLVKELISNANSLGEQLRAAVNRAEQSEREIVRLGTELKRARVLLEVAELFHSTLDLTEIATRILDAVLRWTGAERGVLLLQDRDTGEHLVKVGRELTESVFQSAEVAIPRTIVSRVLETRSSVYCSDVQGDRGLMSMASVRDLNIRSLACIPIMNNADVLGVIYFDYQATSLKLGAEERATLEEVCRHAALALANANRYQKAAEWARRSEQAAFGKLIGTSPQMRKVTELISQVALTPSTSVLITGASGTGKELVARAIHDLSSRRSEPFVAVNCAALPPTLLESELFGYEKGAFTDARTRRIGLIEEADGGTLFLDEIGEMSTSLQSKLLRVLEERTIRRLGGNTDIPVDIRVIAATNKPIEESVKSGEFREDLFYRLNVFPITLPPLKDRGEDVILIANAIIHDLNARLGTRIEPIGPSDPLAQALQSYSWPGNVRELRNVLERAMILSRGNTLSVDDFPPPICGPQPAVSFSPSARLMTLAELEEEHIQRVLAQTGGNKRRAAEILGIDLSTLYRKLDRIRR